MSAIAQDVGDQDLMVLIVGGDPLAFEAFYDRHSGIAFSLTLRILGDHGLAADATQEAFLAFWRSRGRYRPEQGAVRSWFLTIVRNRAIDALRQQTGRAADVVDSSALDVQFASGGPEAEALAHDESRCMGARLRELPMDQRRVVHLAYFQGFTQSEMAEHLDLPLGTIKGQMRLALDKLRATVPV
jgi:RNA polymerase sigma-70 factor (ECF subfamily)